jgi:hypothetical protein
MDAILHRDTQPHLEKPPSQIWVYMSKFGKIC